MSNVDIILFEKVFKTNNPLSVLEKVLVAEGLLISFGKYIERAVLPCLPYSWLQSKQFTFYVFSPLLVSGPAISQLNAGNVYRRFLEQLKLLCD